MILFGDLANGGDIKVTVKDNKLSLDIQKLQTNNQKKPTVLN